MGNSISSQYAIDESTAKYGGSVNACINSGQSLEGSLGNNKKKSDSMLNLYF